MSSEDMFKDVAPILGREPSPSSLGSTPIEFSGVVGGVAEQFEGASTSAGQHECQQCQKILKTKSSLTRHMLLHKLNDYNLRKPVEEQLVGSAPDLFKEVLKDIAEEAAFGVRGTQKRQFIQGLSLDPPSQNVTVFLEEISKPLFDILLVKKKVMPSAQHEESLIKLNNLLANQEFSDSLKTKLLVCVPEDLRNVPDVLVMQLVWRITSNLLYKMQESIFTIMKKSHRTAQDKFVMSDSDKETFKEHVSKMLRSVYRFGSGRQNSVWALRCQCLRDRCVDASEKLTGEQFIDEHFWKENSVSLSGPCVNMFVGLERIMQNLQDTSSPCTADSVFNNLSDPENIILLSELRFLTQGIMSEDVAIGFLQELIKSLVALSGRMNSRRVLDKLSEKQKTSVVSLRTNLKRDPKKSSSAVSGTSGPSVQPDSIKPAIQAHSSVTSGPSVQPDSIKQVIQAHSSGTSGPSVQRDSIKPVTQAHSTVTSRRPVQPDSNKPVIQTRSSARLKKRRTEK